MSALMQWSYGGMLFHYWDLAHKKIGYKNQLSSQHLAATLVFFFYLKKLVPFCGGKFPVLKKTFLKLFLVNFPVCKNEDPNSRFTLCRGNPVRG